MLGTGLSIIGVLVGVIAFIYDWRFQRRAATAADDDPVWRLTLPLGLAWFLSAGLILIGNLM